MNPHREQSSHPTAADLGEAGVISATIDGFTPTADTLLGPGDDAAVLAAASGSVVVASDMLVEGRHFRLDFSAPTDIGRRAIAQNAADIAAMGARCTGFTVAFGCPPTTSADLIAGISAGVHRGAADVGAAVIGGDVTSTEQIVLAVTALGDLDGRSAVLRSGARPGDVVAIAGDVGPSAAGLAVLAAGLPLARYGDLIAIYRVPRPPMDAGIAAAVAGATSMTDVSDGLLDDATAIAAPSGVTIDLTSAAFAVTDSVAAAAAELGIDPRHWIYGAGEDHALLATFPPAAVLPAGWRRCGQVLAAGVHPVTVDAAAPSPAPVWNAFTPRDL